CCVSDAQLRHWQGERLPHRCSFANGYYASPDAEVLYAMVRRYRPHRIVEIGSGHSTLLFREAISDAGSATHLVCVDPFPRREIVQHADEMHSERVELSDAGGLLHRLQ